MNAVDLENFIPMNDDHTKYCRKCGAALQAGDESCGSCGERVPKPSTAVVTAERFEQRRFADYDELPDPSIAPPLFRSIGTGWQILMQDIVGGILAAFGYLGLVLILPWLMLALPWLALTLPVPFVYLIYPIVLVLHAVPFFPIVLVLLAVPLLVGFLGWAEMRRRGQPVGCGSIFSIMRRDVGSVVLWSLVMVAVFLYYPALAMFGGAFAHSLRGYAFSRIPQAPPAWLGLAYLLQLVGYALAPILMSLGALSGWAIAVGHPFGESFGWALRRIRVRFFHWWLAGFVLAIVLAVGAYLFGVGLLIALPVTMLAWAVMAGYKGRLNKFQMDGEQSKCCRKCGAALPTVGDFCKSCCKRIGRPQSRVLPKFGDGYRPEASESASPESEYALEPTELPDPSIAPHLGKALSVAWKILMQDIVGAILTALSYLGIMLMLHLFAIPLLVGFLGWAEMRRRGQPAGCGPIFTITEWNFISVVLWSLVMVGFTALFLLLPMLVWFGGALGQSLLGYPYSGIPLAPTWDGLVYLLQLVSFALVPILMSLGALWGWAIAVGHPFGESFGWAFRRIRARFFRWWLAGFVLGIVLAVGLCLCGVGLLVALPFVMIAWAVMAGYKWETE